jgi:hypothetical protein
MAFSNYTGFPGGLTVGGIPILNSYPDKVFWVDSTSGSNGNKGTFQRPFATLAYALTQTTAAKGQIILIKPGHTETISGAATVTWGTKTSVAVIGLGTGSHRPTFNFTATTSTITMTAANCAIKNCLFTGGIDAVVSPIVVSAADCVIESCEIRDVTGQVTDGILTTSGANRLRILDHIHKGDTAAGTNAGIAIVGGDSIEIQARVMDGNYAVGCIDIRTTATTNLYVHDCGRMYTRNSADIILIDTITGSTGQIGPNINGRLTDNAANITEAFTGATFVYMQPLNLVNAAGESSMQSNITASTDA